jgi:hypothetical protein
MARSLQKKKEVSWEARMLECREAGKPGCTEARSIQAFKLSSLQAFKPSGLQAIVRHLTRSQVHCVSGAGWNINHGNYQQHRAYQHQ